MFALRVLLSEAAIVPVPLVRRLMFKEEMFACREVFNPVSWVVVAKPEMLRFIDETFALKAVRLTLRSERFALFAMSLMLSEEMFALKAARLMFRSDIFAVSLLEYITVELI
jgi:hypothetical protein